MTTVDYPDCPVCGKQIQEGDKVVADEAGVWTHLECDKVDVDLDEQGLIKQLSR